MKSNQRYQAFCLFHCQAIASDAFFCTKKSQSWDLGRYDVQWSRLDVRLCEGKRSCTGKGYMLCFEVLVSGEGLLEGRRYLHGLP
jgi:hypothetical protein